MATPSTISAIGLSTAYFLCGYSLHDSFSTVPALLREGPEVSTRLFAQTYADGALIAIPTGLISLASFAYLAYADIAQRQVWGAAALAMVATFPLTRVVMMPGINRLKSLAKNKEECERASETGEIARRLNTWIGWNYLRAGLFALAGGMGWWALQKS